jgi:uncharacterized membrane protein YfcA
VTLETLLLLSFLAGLVGAMAGMGGGVVLIPALTLTGEDIKHAIAASTGSVIATSSGAASAYVRDHVTNPDHALGRTIAFCATRAAIGAPCMCGLRSAG